VPGGSRRDDAGDFGATWLNLDGWTMLGLPGQTILTTGGWLSGWSNSIVRLSAQLMGPLARMVDDWDTAELAFRLGSGERSQRKPGPIYVVT
jgi:hypothetical protein